MTYNTNFDFILFSFASLFISNSEYEDNLFISTSGNSVFD
jgi:hypothetical protein